jgi:hypothetical protein
MWLASDFSRGTNRIVNNQARGTATRKAAVRADGAQASLPAHSAPFPAQYWISCLALTSALHPMPVCLLSHAPHDELD